MSTVIYEKQKNPSEDESSEGKEKVLLSQYNPEEPAELKGGIIWR